MQITLDGPQENHDKTRVLIGGQPTFETIQKNITNYLDIDKTNNINLRIHLESDASQKEIDGIIETLKLFDDKHKKRIRPYPHIIFSACSELFSKEIDNHCSIETINGKNRSTELTNKIYKKVNELGFGTLKSFAGRQKIACEFEMENNWVVRYDGYLTKCTVGIEKERALAKLTNEGIKLFSERFHKNKKKEFSTKLYEHCSDCELLPFCWQRCTYQHYLNPDFDTFVAKECPKDSDNWMMKRQINEIKARYKKKEGEK